MSFGTNVGLDTTAKASVDLSTSQYLFVKLAAAGLSLCAGAASEACVGVLQNDPTLNQAGSFRYGGLTQVVCGGSFVAGDLIASDAAGKAVKYTKATVFTGTPYIVSGSNVLGVALEAGASGSQSSIVYSPRGLHS
jgi:hypothetical protein